MTKTKVLILHTSVGYGIKATAENIAEQLAQSDEFEVRVEDIGKVESGGLSTLIQKAYSGIYDHMSWLWGFLYNSKIILWLSLPLRKWVASFKSQKTLELLREYQPAIVLSTQAACSGVMAYLKSKNLYRGKLGIVFSDFHLHRFWLFSECDLYVCNIKEQADQLKAMGTPAEKIAITGLFVSQKFSSKLDREEACGIAGLLTTMPTVLLFNGARPRMAVRETFLKMLRSPKTFQVVVVCGKNEELKEQLQKISAPTNHPVKIIGFANNVDVLMSASSVLVGKTGGPTMGEALLKNLPIILTDVRPGHEQANLDFLLSHKVAQFARIPREAVFLTEQILDGKIRFDWANAHRTIIKPSGTVTILEALDTLLPESPSLKVSNYQEI